MREAEVQDAFIAYLQERGWLDITTSKRDADVTARRGAETFVCEVKGHADPASSGLDVDTMYGQLLRRMHPVSDAEVRYAVVVPESMVAAALRVPDAVRHLLGIDIFAVDDFGRVRLSSSPPSAQR